MVCNNLRIFRGRLGKVGNLNVQRASCSRVIQSGSDNHSVLILMEACCWELPGRANKKSDQGSEDD